MGEQFHFKGEPPELGPRLEQDFGCLDEFSGADDLHRVLDELRGAGILECPESLEILVYPSAVEESDVALITVFSTRNPNAHVVAASEEMRKLADHELWEGSDIAALTAAIVKGAVGLANGAIAAVRELEERGAGPAVSAPARCPRCGAEDNLRFEYRYDLLGVSLDGTPVLSEGGELTNIFCLACGKEVDDVLGPRARFSLAPEVSGVPDWCFNNLCLRGDADQLEELREAVASPRSVLDFERVDPTPAEVASRRPDPGTVTLAAMCGAAEAEDPYAWRAAHWGCMRPADSESVHLEDAEEGVLSYRLSTPWSTPDGIAATLAARFPAISVELAFLQPARGFAGAVAFEGGEEASHEECEEPERVRELIEREFGPERAAELLDPAD